MAENPAQSPERPAALLNAPVRSRKRIVELRNLSVVRRGRQKSVRACFAQFLVLRSHVACAAAVSLLRLPNAEHRRHEGCVFTHNAHSEVPHNRCQSSGWREALATASCPEGVNAAWFLARIFIETRIHASLRRDVTQTDANHAEVNQSRRHSGKGRNHAP
jgi:hypothetical protein